ncbi:MAG: GNAT family N-acetyltransferase [Actinomycetota bacterium]|nr:GNAT family N-acetyltransferase [Actinomycetota bacterium]
MTTHGIEVAPCADPADEERSLAVYNAVWPWDSVTMDEVESFKRSMRVYADHLALSGADVVGSAAVGVAPSRPDVAFALVNVLPEHRRRGAGTALYRAVSEWLVEHGLDRIDAPVPEDDPASLAFAARRGFVEVERNSRLVLDLTNFDPPDVDPPPGVRITTWADEPDAARGIYEVACEAYPDVPGEADSVMEPFDDWLAHDMRGSGDLPEATFVAVAGDEVVGYAKFSLTAARPKVASHDMTGVKRAWRGRGIAGALKRAQVAWAKAAGFEQVQTQNEVRNEPIRRLNARLGYRPGPGRVLMRGPLAEVAARA